MAIGGNRIQSKRWLQFREPLEEVRWSANRWWSKSLGWGAMAVPRSLVQTVTADSGHINQVLHWPLTLLLHGCEPMKLVTLNCCCLRADKTDNVLVTLNWVVFVLTLASFGKRLKIGAIAYILETPSFVGNVATLVVRFSERVSERVREFTIIVRTL